MLDWFDRLGSIKHNVSFGLSQKLLIDSVADLDGLTVFVTSDLFSAGIETLILTDDAGINQCWQAWKELILTAINQFISKKTVLDSNVPPLIGQDVKHLINKKYTAL